MWMQSFHVKNLLGCFSAHNTAGICCALHRYVLQPVNEVGLCTASLDHNLQPATTTHESSSHLSCMCPDGVMSTDTVLQ